VVDIDGFKVLHHSLGSVAGDQLLIEVGLRLQSALREGDVEHGLRLGSRILLLPRRWTRKPLSRC
jgi:GGDEF domain-containing protein